ncbi:hypothetical protein (DUF2059) [Owenweeksia hongkongensis DSM 17368]|uniref:DUF2059 domain-containing protein n=2 Tax=Owenweeksia TaxID=267986 RepID=G8R7B0_OWEHD|nr:hypothetical protein (DUF2059) [Owenweeksia hongkongensis DSM 17368]
MGHFCLFAHNINEHIIPEMKKYLFILLITATSQIGFGQKKDKEKDIRTLLELTGSAKLGIQALDKMLVSFRDIYPNVPTEFWEEVRQEVNPNDLVDMIVPIYDDYYTLEDILALIEFYKSDIGQKMTQVQSGILEDSMNVGRKWGEDLAKKVVKRMERKGY